jgi:hypothetical protein
MDLAMQQATTVTDVSVVHPAANSYSRQAAHTAGAAASLRDASKFRKHGGGGQVAAGSFTPLSMESYGRSRAEVSHAAKSHPSCALT